MREWLSGRRCGDEAAPRNEKGARIAPGAPLGELVVVRPREGPSADQRL